jgi:hypothetical protein
MLPDRAELPEECAHLVDWYEGKYSGEVLEKESDPLLVLRGSGRELWANEHADDYVKRLREGWV